MTEPKLGDRAIYRPRVPYGRQSDLFCFITRIADAEQGTVDLIAFPAASEVTHINNVARRCETINIHCWEPHSGGATGDNSDLLSLIAELEERVATLEAKRGPGRPPKVEAA
jgi:hypothetical protein